MDYINRISEAWLGGSAAIKACDILIPDDDNFRSQCLSRRQRVGTSGKLQVEPKDEYIKRGFESPHEGDAIFGAMLPVRQNQRVNLIGLTSEPQERSWVDRGYEAQERIASHDEVLRNENIL